MLGYVPAKMAVKKMNLGRQEMTKKSFVLASAVAVAMFWGATASAGEAKAPKKFQARVGQKRAAAGWKAKSGRYHFRVTTKKTDKAKRVHGKVCTGGVKNMKKLKKVKLEGKDDVRIGPKKKCVHFDFKTNGHVDGFSFRTPATILWFTVKVNEKKMKAKRIFIGKNPAKKAKSNPAAYRVKK
jgi:hypothetical protein